MEFKKLLAGAIACCVVGGYVPVSNYGSKNLSVLMTAMAVERGRVEQIEKDGFVYNIYGTYDFATGEILTREYAGIAGYNGKSGSIEIPSAVNGIPVLHIDEEAFWGNQTISKVTIPDGIVSIGESAFRECNGIASLTIPDSVLSIGSFAFSGCSSMVKIKLPADLASLSSWIFHDCKALASIDIPNGVTSIGGWAFSGCEALTKVTVPDSVLVMKEGSFGGCSGLLSITLPCDLTSISDGTFDNCYSLKSIVLPDGVSIIGENAFRECKSLTKITFPADLTVIKNGAFYRTGFTEFTFPEGVSIISNEVLGECNNLKSVNIPASVEKIGESAFVDCPNLKNIVIPENVETMDEYCFGYYSGLTWSKYEDVSITGYKGSAAEAYASKNEITFIDILNPPMIVGDVNNDGSVDISDLVTLQSYILGKSDKLESWQNADLCEDGVIDSFDMAMLRRLLIKQAK